MQKFIPQNMAVNKSYCQEKAHTLGIRRFFTINLHKKNLARNWTNYETFTLVKKLLITRPNS